MHRTSYWRPAASALALLIAVRAAPAADWPTHQRDAARNAVSLEQISAPLSEDWVFTATHPPCHAWGDPQPKPIEGNLELPRMRFDAAFHVVAAGDLAFFGSSADTKVYALNATSGDVVWEFYTDGPVRFAPTVADGRLYVGSDDGMVYCLNAADGALSWSFAAAPGPEKVLGNGKMISVWPVRTSVLVDGGAAYFGAGVFPGEGLYMYALDAGSGKLLWKNDTYARGGKGGVTPQGYMLASKDKLFVPSGRCLPAVFNRKDGRYLFQPSLSWRAVRPAGGTYCVLAGDLLYCGTEQIAALRQTNGGLAFTEDARRLAVGKDVAYFLTGKELVAVDRPGWIAISKARLPTKMRVIALEPALRTLEHQRKRLVKKKAEPPQDLLTQIESTRKQLDAALAKSNEFDEQLSVPTKWRAACEFVDAIALAQGTVFAGGAGAVKAFDVPTGKESWSAPVNGTARGIAIANGRVLVTTDKGSIHCFVAGDKGKGRKVTPAINAEPFPKDDLAEFHPGAAARIVTDSGVTRGYALVLGGGTGRLALELAKRTDLLTYMVEPDAGKLATARKALSAAGVYGGKVVALKSGLEALTCSDYFANLIVCEAAFLAGAPPTPAAEVLRLLKPCGGVCYVGCPPDGPTPAPTAAAALQNWLTALRAELDRLGETGAKITVEGSWAKIVRGALSGADDWTHQYADAGNTGASKDTAARGPLGVLWFGEPGPGKMPSRHASAAAPLSVAGRMFVQGENVIMAYDAYNGAPLWERAIRGAMRLGLKHNTSNLAANEDSLFAVVGGKCLRLDAATGKTVRTYNAPPGADKSPRPWGGYLACVNGLLYGTTYGLRVFAVDLESGEPRWVHEAKRIMLTTVCIDAGRLFFVDLQVPKELREECLKAVDPKSRIDRLGQTIPPDVRLVTALNAETGEKLWQSPQYVSDCVKISKGGGELIAMAANNVLLLCGQPWNGHFWPEFFAGEFSRRSLIAISAYDGRPLWSGRKGYRSRPLIVGNQIIAEPWAHDLKTGDPILRTNPVTGARSKWQMSRPGHHCGNIAGSPNLLFFRSGTLAYLDLETDSGVMHWGAQRSGCWVNFVPAAGLVLVPEASSGCVCPFSLHCTTVFSRRKNSRLWAMYSDAGGTTPAKDMAVNFGAPGDRKGADGTLWLAFPRPSRVRLVLDFNLETQFAGGGFFSDDANFVDVAETDDDWLYASGARGLRRCVLPLVKEEDGAALYTVRLAFAADKADKPGQRVFAVKLQGETVAEAVDVAAMAGGPNKALVREFQGVKTDGNLTLELVPKAAKPAPEQVPVVHGVHVIRERVLHVGMAVPTFMVNDAIPKQTQQVRIANHTDKPFNGTLQVTAPDRFAAEPAAPRVELAPGQATTVPIAVSVQQKGEKGDFELLCKLVDGGGRTEFERKGLIEYLARCGRCVVTPSADAHVAASASTANYGRGGTLAVDGGSAAMRDRSHSIAYLKFPLDVPGKAASVTLRLFVPPGGHTQSSDSGRVKLVEAPWDEYTINYKNAPKPGQEIGVVGRVAQSEWAERKLDVDLSGRTELSIAVDPTSCDGATYVSREGKEKPELVIEYEVAE